MTVVIIYDNYDHFHIADFVLQGVLINLGTYFFSFKKIVE